MFTQNDLDLIFGKKTGESVKRFPLTNIATDSVDNLIIELALAGYDKSDIKIESKGNKLSISGSPKPDENDDIKYHQEMISKMDFERKLILHEDYVDGKISADMENGILTIIIIPNKQNIKIISIQ